MDAPPAPRSRELSTALANLRVDAATVAVLKELRSSGIEAILLRGPVLDRLLYSRRGERSYTDADLLVSPEDFAAAEGTLASLGFRPYVEEAAFADKPGHARAWQRDADGMLVDLHHTLLGAAAPYSRIWTELRAATRSSRLGDLDVLVPDRRAAALVVALHAASHGPREKKPTRDLERALALLDRGVWESAAELADRVDGGFAFAAGLRRLPAGAAIADELGLARRYPADVALRASQRRQMGLELQELAATPGVRAKLALARAVLVPPPTRMRAWHALARRGRAGLAAAYARRLLRLPIFAGPAALSLWRARRLGR